MYQLNITISGRVQGVNLRRSLQAFARSKQIVGYVKNCENGSVECVAQGEETQLNELLEKCQKGFGLAKVQAMQFSWSENPKSVYEGFEITKDYKNFFIDQAHSFVNLGKNLLTKQEKIVYPKHIVIIPDGNRRWARAQGWKPWVGHQKAMVYDNMQKLLDVAFKYNILHFTFWGFSTENWNRDQTELDVLFDLYRENISMWKAEFMKESIKFTHFGRKDRLPKDIIQSMQELEDVTKNNIRLNFHFCLDYNGRDDLVRAINKMMENGLTSVDETTISSYLDTGMHSVPDPDLIIRTSGEQRTSGIMAYQAAYAELYFTKMHFPDFDDKELERAILDYAGRTRRFGGTHIKDVQGISTVSLIEPKV